MIGSTALVRRRRPARVARPWAAEEADAAFLRSTRSAWLTWAFVKPVMVWSSARDLGPVASDARISASLADSPSSAARPGFLIDRTPELTH